MNRIRTCLCILIIGAWSHFPIAAHSDPGLESCDLRFDAYQDNLFSVESVGGIGVASFVGRRADQLWLVTPAHVLLGENNGNRFQIDPAIEITVRSSKGASMKLCEGFAPSFAVNGLDITFICVRGGADTFVHDEVLADRVSSSDHFVVVGNGDSIRATRTGAKIERMAAPDPKTGANHRLNNIDPQPGDSGSLVANCRGIVGMVLDSERHVMDFDLIAENASEAEVPWTISTTEYFDPDARTQVCVEFEEGTSRLINFTPLNNGAVIPIDGCANVPHAKYAIRSGDRDFNCSPQYLVVSTRSVVPVIARLRCSVALNGTWISSDSGELSCIESSPGHAQCSGLTNMRAGIFSGLATSLGDQGIRLRGQFATATHSEQTKGDFKWIDGQLRGTLTVGAVRRELSLRRLP